VKRPSLLIFALVLAAVGFSACGSASSTSPGGSTSSTDTAASDEGSLSKAEFVARADALCAAAKTKQEPLRTKLGQVARKARGEEREQGTVSNGTRAELAQTLDQIVAIAEADRSRLEGLGMPQTDAPQLEAIFQKLESAFAVSRAYAAALEAHEDARAQAVAEKGNAETRETASLASRYGFKVCGAQP
jgi:hypothetical protein